MSDSFAVVSPDIARNATWRERLHRRFFVAVSIAMLAIVLLGFGPTLFFRPLFDVARIPDYLFVHGIVLSAWYVWFFVQASLIATRRTEMHRRLGVVGVLIAACVVAASLMVIVNFLPRMREVGADFEAQGVNFAAGQIGDSLTLVAFVAMVSLAVAWRRRPELHKRLMFFASLQILGPAGARTPATFAALGLSPIETPFWLFLTLAIGGPVAYDFIARGRLHVVTVVCVPIQIGSVVMAYVIASNESIRALILGSG